MSSTLFGRGDAGVAAVRFEAVGVAETTRDIDRVENTYLSSLDKMSDGAIKLRLAEDRLQRQIRRGPGNYNAVARAELGVRRARSELERETRQLDRTEDRRNRNLGRRRGSLAAYTAGYIGTTGLILAIRSSIAAAREEELILGQTRIAVEAAGLAWERYETRIQAVIRAQSALGFDDEALLKTFSVFIRRTEDVDEALRLNALTADVARGRYIDLEAAQQIVLKASIGMAGQLRRLGLDVEKNATSTELLTFLTKAYGQAAEEAATTGIAAQDRFNVAIENTKEALGRGLLPTVTQYTNEITRWLDTAGNQEELQRRVNEAVETGEKVVRGLADGMELVAGAVEPVIDALGGLENAVELALILGLLRKAKRAAGGFGLIAAASKATTASVVRDAAIAEAALDVAYRPRAVTVLPGAPVPGPGGGPVIIDPRTGRPRTPSGGGGRLGRLGRLGRGALRIGGLVISGAALRHPAVLEAIAASQIPSGGGAREGQRRASRRALLEGDFADRFPFLTNAARRAVQGNASPGELSILLSVWNATDTSVYGAAERRLRALDRRSRDDGLRRPEEGAAGQSIGAEQQRRQRRRRRGAGRTTLTDLDLDLARAEATAGTADDARERRRRRDFFQRQIDALERRSSLTKAQKERLARLYGQLAAEDAALDSIAEVEEQRIAEARERRAEERRQRRERARQRQEARERLEERDFDRFERRTRRRDLRGASRGDPLGGFGGAQAGARAAARRGGRAGGDADRGLSEADVRRLHFDFLSSLHGVVGQFGSNIAIDGMGQVATHAHAQTSLLLEQNQLLERMFRSGGFPGTSYARADLAAAGIGAGF